MKVSIPCLLAIVLMVCHPSPTTANSPPASNATTTAATTATTTPHDDVATLFDEVAIESYPTGSGFAQKTAKRDGGITGLHMSGPPGPINVYASQETVSAEDMTTLNKLVAKVQSQKPPKTDPPDQKVEGYKSLIIRNHGDAIAYHAKFNEPFPSADVQAIWDLLAKYHAGGW